MSATLSPVYNPKLRVEHLMEGELELLDSVDIAQVNLLCVPRLAGSEDLDISDCMAKLERVTAFVQNATERHLPNFRNDPDYGHSEAMWRMAMLVTKLKRDYGARYDPDVSADVQAGRYSPFTDARNVFIHGVLDADENKRLASCTSMPVFVIAVGRRLGYPLHLVACAKHLFARWDDGQGTRFNIEASNPMGMSVFPDEYYRNHPRSLSRVELESGCFLTNLTRAQEFAHFMMCRVWCLQDKTRYDETLLWGACALQFHPNEPHFPRMAGFNLDLTIKSRYKRKYPDRKLPAAENPDQPFFNIGEFGSIQERSLFLTIMGHEKECEGKLTEARECYEAACRQNRWGVHEQHDLQRFLKKYNLPCKAGPLMPPKNLGQLRHFKLKVPPAQEAAFLLRLAADFERRGQLLNASYALQDLYLFDPCSPELYRRYRAMQSRPGCQAELRAKGLKQQEEQERLRQKFPKFASGNVYTLDDLKGPLNVVNINHANMAVNRKPKESRHELQPNS